MIYIKKSHRSDPIISNIVSYVLSLALTMALAIYAPPATAKDSWRNIETVIAIGDIHGDYEQYLAILKDNQLIDEQLDWQGGKTHLVQIGDIVDRGPDSLKVIRHLKKLQKQAKKTNGYVHMLLGNHELMNIQDDLRYVHPGEYKILINKNSSKKRNLYIDRVFNLMAKRTPALLEKKSAEIKKLKQRFPLGFVEHRFIWAPKGELFEWARKNNTVIKINRTLFAHGGLSPHAELISLKEINKRIRRVITKGVTDKLSGNEGPLWYRGLAYNNTDKELAPLLKMLKYYDADNIVVAHTPTAGTIMPKFDGRVILADVGISQHYGGRRANLLMLDNVMYTIHRGHKIRLPTDTTNIDNYIQEAANLDPKPSPLLSVLPHTKPH